MRNRLIGLGILFFVFVLWGCSPKNSHFITDATYRQTVEKDLAKKREVIKDGKLFDFLDNDSLKTKEHEAMQFLYAYMNLADIVDYSSDFYLQNVRASFKAQEEMPWGKDVPEKLFRHFVLPVRVNNESLDSSRIVFYGELKDRVKGLSMKDAALEVNHWCHEKAIYAPSDARTRSPLATVKTALGRCGEESTFAVAALRSVGIPARQVYTPRWAHTDDNHAWVEVWVDGKWHFMGACEPKAGLDDAWFNSSVVRAMLIHTKVFGRYDGPEEILYNTDNYTEINVIDNYAPTDELAITVVDQHGKAVPNANVEYCIYNYAEFYPVVKKSTDKQGKSSLRIGKGDMMVWAFKDGKFGYQVSKADERKALTIQLGDFEALPETTFLKLIPPSGTPIAVSSTPQQVSDNEKRMLKEDSIRTAYEKTFYNEDTAKEYCKSLPSEKKDVVTKMLVQSRGNHKEITDFLSSVSQEELNDAIGFLNVLSEKDLTDTPATKLKAIFKNMPRGLDEFGLKYIGSPRISDEYITDFRSDLTKALNDSDKEGFRANPSALARWINTNIQLDTLYNSQRLLISPSGVLKARRGDAPSRNLFFVAMARSLDIPSRIDPVTGKVQYSMNKGAAWTDVNIQANTSKETPQGMISMSYKPTNVAPDPEYYSRFTLDYLTPAGKLNTLYYDWDGQNAWSKLFKEPKSVDAGNYILTSGTRMASGSVLCCLQKVIVPAGAKVSIPLILPQDSTDIQVIGSINAENIYYDLKTNAPTSILQTTGRGYFIIGILGAGQEPTNHALKDIQLLKTEFEKWGRKMVLLFPNEDSYKRFKQTDFPNLPNTVVWGLDIDGKNTDMIAKATNLHSSSSLPIFIIGDSFGRVVFVSQGYTIGLGEQLMNIIRRL